MYQPNPIDTHSVMLPSELLELTELIARNVHDIWAENRMAEGWRYGPQRDAEARTTPLLVPYHQLPEAEKRYDRDTAMETLRLIVKLGYRISREAPAPEPSPGTGQAAHRCPVCGSGRLWTLEELCRCDNCGHVFSRAPRAGKHVEPLRLFLSYGRPESAICQRIFQALKERGHDPWFDESEIRTGQNWRDRIVDGISKSQEVLACLSPHSTREHGVCLEELAIAVGVKGGNIHSILLGPEGEVNPPATVRHIQWLDMSDWKSRYEAGPETFEPWFQRKMEELFTIVESPENRAFVGEISRLRSRLDVHYSTGRQNALLKRDFVGRVWLANGVDRWLDEAEAERICVVYGAPGIGKSAFAAHYVHYNHRVAAGLFCHSGRDTFNDPRVVLQTLAYLLACRLPEYRRALLLCLPEEGETLERLSAEELFEELLQKPLSLSIDGGRENMVVVIDGLDECGDAERNALAQVLVSCARGLPGWIRFLVTARPVSPVTSLLSGARRLELTGTQANNRADVTDYFRMRLEGRFSGHPLWKKALETLVERSQGIFLYAELMCGLLEERGTPELGLDCPEELEGVFTLWFRNIFPDERVYRDEFRGPLGVVAGAPEPVPEEELLWLFAWDENRLQDFRRRMGVLLRREKNLFGQETLVVDHDYVRRWLLTRQDSPYHTAPGDAVRTMALGFFRRLEGETGGVTRYEAVHLPCLLKKAGLEEAYWRAIQSRKLHIRIYDAGCEYALWGRWRQGRALLERGLELARVAGWAAGSPDALEVRALYQNALARNLEKAGDLAGQRACLMDMLEAWETLARQRGTPEDWRELEVAFCLNAQHRWATGELAEAAALLERALEVDRRLVREENTQRDKRCLAGTCETLAQVREEQGLLQQAGALRAQARELTRCEAQAPDKPEDLDYWLSAWGRLQEEEGDLAGARESYEACVALHARVPMEDWQPWRYRLAGQDYHNLSEIQRKQGDWGAARRTMETALALEERLQEIRGNLYDRLSLVRNSLSLAALLPSDDRRRAALEERSRELCRTLQDLYGEEGIRPETFERDFPGITDFLLSGGGRKEAGKE